jgi:hypothetical protein
LSTPNHYTRWKIEPITFIRANNLPFSIANIIKYVMRYDAKDGIKDLEKARQYLDWLIEDTKPQVHRMEVRYPVGEDLIAAERVLYEGS